MKLTNDRFFVNVINRLNDGGTYIWPIKEHMYVKMGNKLIAQTQEGYDDIKAITTLHFSSNYIDLKPMRPSSTPPK